MKDKTLKFYWSFFCVVLATFIAVVAMYVVFPNVDDTHSVPPVTECKIVLSEGDKYQAVSYITSVKKGTDATFELFFEEGYAFDGCDYMEYELLIGENSSLLMLKNILYPTSVEVYMKEIPPIINKPDEPSEPIEPEQPIEPDVPDLPETPVIPTGSAGVHYHVNGGTMYENNDNSWYTIIYSMGIYPRINTDKAIDKIGREGYVLTGWNTAEDGSGMHIGLGSRYTVIVNDTINLYAEWSKCTADENFEYSLIDTEDISALYFDTEEKKTLTQLVAESNSNDLSAVITKYNGVESPTITIPETIHGYPVAGIAKNAVKEHLEIETVVLNSKIKFLQDYAFQKCNNIKSVYLYDNIERVDRFPFGSSPKVEKLYMNAVESPVYGETENGQFANKMEMLINDKSELSKMVFFGGCSLLYGLDSSVIEAAYPSRYSVFNMGVIGGTCATFQLDLIYRYMGDQDVLVHIPELASIYQLLGDVSFDSRVYMTVENNYDLLALLDLQSYTNVFYALNQYLIGKQMLLDTGNYQDAKYVEKLETINKYGDLIKEREGWFENEGEAFRFVTKEEFEASPARSVIKSYYEKFHQNGINVYYGFAPINKDGLNEDEGEDLVKAILQTFETDQIPVVSIMEDLQEVKLESRYFYDTNYHLSTEGAQIYTSVLLVYLQEKIR